MKRGAPNASAAASCCSGSQHAKDQSQSHKHVPNYCTRYIVKTNYHTINRKSFINRFIKHALNFYLIKVIISIYSCQLFINSHCDYISIDMSEDHILIHIMLDDVAVKKMSRQAKNYYSLHNIPKGKFYICQHI